jgi:hypothetical protein
VDHYCPSDLCEPWEPLPSPGVRPVDGDGVLGLLMPLEVLLLVPQPALVLGLLAPLVPWLLVVDELPAPVVAACDPTPAMSAWVVPVVPVPEAVEPVPTPACGA